MSGPNTVGDRAHDWVPHGKPGGYKCRVCGVTGHAGPHTWPPVRNGQYALPAYKTCEGTVEQAMRDTFKKYNITAEDL